ncbi:MAG: geranylgeranyl reductase family protein [Candidatus Hodarchaeota archaeon]
MSDEYDVIVVGAGTGGAIAARFAQKFGLKTLLVDRKAREDIGKKICGDALPGEIFDQLGIAPPKGDELDHEVKGARLLSPDGSKEFKMIDEKQAGYLVNRHKFGQRLVNDAISEGVEFWDKVHVKRAIQDGFDVKGIEITDSEGNLKTLRSKILIDASGFYSLIRDNVKSNYIEKDIAPEDTILCYREIVNIEGEVDSPDYITIHLTQDLAPGGYIWYFPKGPNQINIGLGGPQEAGKKVGSIIKKRYEENVFKKYVKNEYDIVSSGAGAVPVRRPLWSLVDNGIMMVGDSACQVNPLHGGGIDTSMLAGYMAASTAKKAIEEGDTSINGLWEYNEEFMRGKGAQFAALDILRIALQHFTDEDLNFGLKNEILSGEDILEIAYAGGLKLTALDAIKKVFKIGLINTITHGELIINLAYVHKLMTDIKKLYEAFPGREKIENFELWKKRVEEIYKKIKGAF